ncbi:acetate--CoA ligase family protein [Modicisalibacter muralis]|uniref:acetate--CoA ligase family protein n=1 Tax=Modicisalibacter muralis TaxID=119000 RepID=UPI001587AB6F|nr:acetate--CoA ligase family protein [Halomonas muralis]
MAALLQQQREAGNLALDEKAGKAALAAFGINVPYSAVAGADPAAAADAACGFAGPYVVKVLSSRPLHKSDLGGVRLGLRDPEAVAEAAEEILADWTGDRSWIEGFLVEQMASAGQELVIGGFVDPQFGPMIMVGLGGVFVEIFADVAFRVCPIQEPDAREMLEELRALPILRGARGRTPISEEALLDVLMKVGGEGGLLMQLGNDLQEFDINPLIVGPDSAVAVDARLVLASSRRPSDGPRPTLPSSFEPLFAPKTIAVAGVSSSGKGAGNRFINNLRRLDFQGDVYVIHPSADSVAGLPAYRSLAETPKLVDYAYVAVPRQAAPELLAGAQGRVAFAQVMTSGFDEHGEGPGSQAELLQAARRGSVRVLGPNCLGTYSPRGRITFAETEFGADAAGCVGVVSQSGGFGVDLVRRGQMRGLRFRGLVTVGNSIDLGPNDLLEHFINDKQTRVIGMYLEDISDGRRFVELLQASQGRKPVVLLKGGRTEQGQQAAASHTGSLAGNAAVWKAVAGQTGCVLVDTVEELIETLMLFQTLEANLARPTRRLVLFGNGGGASVVASDGFAERGFELARFADDTRKRLIALELPDGASGSNPIDLPANAFNRTDGRVANDILAALKGDSGVDAIIAHFNLPVLLSYRESDMVKNMIDACIAHRSANDGDQAHLILVLRSDGSAEVDQAQREHRHRAIAAGIPVFDDFTTAGRALAGLARYEDRSARRNDPIEPERAPSHTASDGGKLP